MGEKAVMTDYRTQATAGWSRNTVRQCWVKGTKKVYGPLESGDFCISDHDVWMPGAFDTFETAVRAFDFTDEILHAKQQAANDRAGGVGGTITAGDLP